MKTALVCGAGGFIGSHLATRLKADNYRVVGVDLKYPEFGKSSADEFIIADLRDAQQCMTVTNSSIDEIYQLAADMGGAGYLFTGKYDAAIMYNSATINLNLLESARIRGIDKLFYTSSACIYPRSNQGDPAHPICSENTAYPADPDSEYGWEKLFSERLYLAYAADYGMQVRVARLHNVFGEQGCWCGGREKSLAAICRKIAEAEDGDSIAIWGDGEQTRSYLYIDECVEGIRRLMTSECAKPVNLGSEEMVTVNTLADMTMAIAGKRLTKTHVTGPQGVRGRNSDNRMLEEQLGWRPSLPLQAGLERTYRWIDRQVRQRAGRSGGHVVDSF